MDDSELSGLDLDAARELIFAYAVDIKRYDKELASARGELDRWSSRAKLADEKGLPELAAQARAKADETASKMGSLELEQGELKARLERLRQQLPLIRAGERSVDPDRLLAELQMMTGELLGGEAGSDRPSAATERELAKLEADAAADTALDALKRKMGGQTPPDGGATSGGGSSTGG